MELQAGHRIKDNDPRMFTRVLTIVRVTDRFVYAKDVIGKESRIQVRRVHTDGKPRRSGFSLLLYEQAASVSRPQAKDSPSASPSSLPAEQQESRK